MHCRLAFFDYSNKKPVNRKEDTMANIAVQIHTIPCLSDNYAFLIHNHNTGTASIVDVPEAKPIIEKIIELDTEITEVFLTHHHADHIDGLPELKEWLSARQKTVKCKIIGAKADAHRLPELDQAVKPGQNINMSGIDGQVIDVSGHTIGHIALHMNEISALFSADSLMAMGCGRLFEGSAVQMWQSLVRLRALPDNTTVYSGHEYTASNMAFAQSLEDTNSECSARAAKIAKNRLAGIPTVPSNLGLEKRTNPFLRVDDAKFQAAIGMAGLVPEKVFAKIRKKKDNF
jgi:hydroxyacylglutathione hydrolase